jgi:uncharacterized membrane protein YhaH (DUF805 family)
MSARVKRNWWIPAPIALIGLGVYTMLTHIVGDGYESPWSHTASGWAPSTLERVGTVALLGFFFVALPVWALAVRRAHPGATLAALLPWVLMSLPPLMWSDAGGMLILPALGIVTLVGATANLVQRYMETGPEPPTPETQRAGS